MKCLHIIGRKNHGKTHLVAELVRLLTSRGLRVATIKHTHHSHELDTPGKDSWHHREAGAAMVGVIAGNMTAVFIPHHQALPPDERHALLDPLLSGCDLVLVEGNHSTTAPRIEVWRAGRGTEPVCLSDRGILALVTDDPVAAPPGLPVFSRSNPEPLLEWIEKFRQ